MLTPADGQDELDGGASVATSMVTPPLAETGWAVSVIARQSSVCIVHVPVGIGMVQLPLRRKWTNLTLPPSPSLSMVAASGEDAFPPKRSSDGVSAQPGAAAGQCGKSRPWSERSQPIRAGDGTARSRPGPAPSSSSASVGDQGVSLLRPRWSVS